MGNELSAEHLQRYRDEGVVFPVPAVHFDRAELELGRALEFLGCLGPEANAVHSSQVHLFLPWAFDLALEPRVLDAVESILGENLVVWATTVFAKPPATTAKITWHQDATYWGLDSAQVTTAWIALSPSNERNGCMRVEPGTQELAIQPHHESFAADNLLSRGQEIQVEVDETAVVDVVLEAGEMSLHHVNLVHGSNPNCSDGWRVGFVVRYVTPEVRQVGQTPRGVLARGRDDFGHFEWVDRPIERPLVAAVAALREFNKDFLAPLMRSDDE